MFFWGSNLPANFKQIHKNSHREITHLGKWNERTWIFTKSTKYSFIISFQKTSLTGIPTGTETLSWIMCCRITGEVNRSASLTYCKKEHSTSLNLGGIKNYYLRTLCNQIKGFSPNRVIHFHLNHPFLLLSRWYIGGSSQNYRFVLLLFWEGILVIKREF